MQQSQHIWLVSTPCLKVLTLLFVEWADAWAQCRTGMGTVPYNIFFAHKTSTACARIFVLAVLLYSMGGLSFSPLVQALHGPLTLISLRSYP